MMLLAAIEGGSTEAVLWFIPLEVVLGEISRRVKNSSFLSRQQSQQEKRLQDSLLNALASFVYGVALNNVAFRCYYQYLITKKDKSEPSPLQKWYTSIYNSDPRCAFPECLRLLPYPSLVRMNQVRKSFSIGMLDARTGCRMARSFISGRTRMGPIYVCIASWTAIYEPHPIMINALLWFGNVFHADSSCKAARGKWL